MHARLAALLCVLLAPVANAAGAPVPAPDALGAGSVLQLTLSLAAVIGAIFGLGWLLRRLHGLPGSTHRALRVIATLPVGTRDRIAIIQAGSTQVLIGVSPGRIQTLHVLEHPVAEAAQRAPTFKSLFDRERAQCDS
jgi:flagellar protein FliO/FliZ